MPARLISFPRHVAGNGALRVYESPIDVPFAIQRVFTVSAKKGDVRGRHAHKACTQLLVCGSGQIRVTCDEGASTSEHTLDGAGPGLLVSPGVWASEEYLTDDALLVVLCDRPYESDDYIRDYAAFKEYVGRQT
jgi:dTDP-4-dehydrorhamnose 3,5-epimerase-like enzyme